MSLPLSLEAPSPLEYFATLVAEDEHFALLEAAASLGQDAEPDLDTQSVMGEIDALGERLKRRLPADASAMHRLRTLNRYFFRELGFAGNVNDYYDASNSYLHQVLASRRGIPITLALLYIELAGHAGLVARGVSFPGHFLVKLRLPHGEAVMDPFNGRALSREELE
jgi:regulator of sirC expression with transglutaminase-like and TPR domain